MRPKAVRYAARFTLLVLLGAACGADIGEVSAPDVWRNFRNWDGATASIHGFLSTDRVANRQRTGLVCESLLEGTPPRTGGDCLVYVGLDIRRLRGHRTAGEGMWTPRSVILEGTIRDFMGWGERPEFVVSGWSFASPLQDRSSLT